MPLYRGFFGKAPPTPVDDPTRRIVRTKGDQNFEAIPSPLTDPGPAMEDRGGVARPSGSTVGATRRVVRADPAPASKPLSAPSPAAQPTAPVKASIRDPLANPVVGWLAVVAGPGLGEALPLSYGVNDIGRGADVRVRLDFGDDTIAGGDQSIMIYAAIIYTARTRRFYLQSVAAETWLGERVVNGSMELTGGDTLRLGQTCLRFVPLCGPNFDWRDGG